MILLKQRFNIMLNGSSFFRLRVCEEQVNVCVCTVEKSESKHFFSFFLADKNEKPVSPRRKLREPQSEVTSGISTDYQR